LSCFIPGVTGETRGVYEKNKTKTDGESPMFGIGMPEMIMILVVALIVIGPKKLPDLAKSLGRALGEFKRATNDLKTSIDLESDLKSVQSTFDDAKDGGAHDVKKDGSEPVKESAPPESKSEDLENNEPKGKNPESGAAKESSNKDGVIQDADSQ
jgi:sec-independent protein translocase protein TatB